VSYQLIEKAVHSLLLNGLYINNMYVHCSAINLYALNILACSIIQGCTTIKLNTKFSAVCTQIVPYCGILIKNAVEIWYALNVWAMLSKSLPDKTNPFLRKDFAYNNKCLLWGIWVQVPS